MPKFVKLTLVFAMSTLICILILLCTTTVVLQNCCQISSELFCCTTHNCDNQLNQTVIKPSCPPSIGLKCFNGQVPYCAVPCDCAKDLMLPYTKDVVKKRKRSFPVSDLCSTGNFLYFYIEPCNLCSRK